MGKYLINVRQRISESLQLTKSADDTSPFEPISGQLVLNTTNIAGKIAYVPGISKPDFWTMLLEIQNQGASAIAIVFRAGSRKTKSQLTNTNICLFHIAIGVPGLAFCNYNGEDFLADVVIPIVQTSRYDFDAEFLPILERGEELNITITPGGTSNQ